MHKEPFDENAITPHNLTFDPQDYIEDLEGMDLTDEEAETLLKTLWEIMILCVDLGLEANPDTQATLSPKAQDNLTSKPTLK